jgi:CRISPR-associated endonuclease/helicase Cas3
MWAHSRNERGRRHGLVEHLEATGELARGFAEPFGAGDLAHALGLLHDLGKARAEWQSKLLLVEGDGGRVNVDHKGLGTRMLKPFAGLLAGCVLGHHGGLPDRGKLNAALRESPEGDDEALAAVRAASPRITRLLSDQRLLLPISWQKEASVCEIGARLAFSALVDADHLDTAAHFDGLSSARVRPPADLAALVSRFEAGRTELLAARSPSPIDGLREQVYRAAVRAAAGPTGIYRLPAPTGSGKTLSAAAFALHHAARAGKRRVVVAVPFLTITEQNARVYRGLLGDEAVIEHHSGVDLDGPSGSSAGLLRQRRAAAENWDAPFVVTTTVQLFDSLFGRKPSRSRKLHRLAGAVLVLDEVQALPMDVLPIILEGLKILTQHFGTTVLLASATQPAFQALGPWKNLAVKDVVGDEIQLYERLGQRVAYEWRTAGSDGHPAPDITEIADEVAGQAQALVVVNRVADARQMFRLVQGRASVPVRHLSTRMFPGHRRAVIADVRARLAAGDPVLVISTQLIEAGVDLDFPVVFRAMAPAESLQQAAGRSNREGSGDGAGRVVVFEVAQWKVPAFYRTAVDHTRRFFGPGRPPDDPGQLTAYYQALYASLNLAGGHRAAAVTKSREQLNFEAVAEGPEIDDRRDRSRAFRMIDDESAPVVVQIDADLRASLTARLDAPSGPGGPLDVGDVAGLLRAVRAGQADRDVFRQLQKVTVALPKHALERPDVQAMVKPVIGDMWEWVGPYDPDVGLDDGDLVRDSVW